MKKKLLSLFFALLCAIGSWADTDILSSEAGWSKINSLPATLSDYYFVFVDKNNDLMLFYNTGTDGKQGENYKTMFYSTSQDPTQNRGMLWEISTNNGGWSIKSAVEPTLYIQTEWNAGWYARAHDNGGGDDSWYKWTINYVDETDVWTIQNGKYPESGYIGPWDAASFSNGSEVAGNKTATADIGHFYIYAIKKIDANVLPAITYLESRTDKRATITPLRTKYTDGTYTNSTTANDVYDDYKALEVETLSSASAGNYTSALINPSFESGTMTGWTTLNQSNETYPFYLSDVGVKSATNPTYQFSNSDGDYIMNYYGWSWSWNADINGIKQTIPNMPAGTYRIKTVMAGWKDWQLTLKVNSESENKTMTAADTGVEFSKDITLEESGDLTIIVEANHIDHNDWEACFLKADNFRIYNLTHYYDELNDAITAAEAKTLGFEAGEYAPYSNVTAINAIDEAKAIDQNEYIEWSELQTLVSKLTSWTVNEGDMECVYNGDFAIGQGSAAADIQQYGWTRTNNWGNFRDDSDKSSTSKGTSYYNQPGSLQYGNAGKYTMPLKANTIYTLTFKYASWESNQNESVTASVLNSSDGMAAKNYGKNATVHTAENAFATKTIKFVTGAAGNYILTLANSGNTVITDVSITKADQTLTLPSAIQYAAGTYPTVSLDRSFSTTKRSTMVLPFAMTEDETSAAFDEVYEMNDVVDSSIKFTKATAITAGKPYLVMAKNATLSVTNKEIDPSTTVSNTVVEKGSSTVTFVGTFSPITLTSENSNAYIVSSNTLYNVDSNVSVPAYRGYFTVDTTSGVKNFVLSFDDETAIESIDDETMENAPIYNLAGQRVNKAQKGIYIVNGKKMLVK